MKQVIESYGMFLLDAVLIGLLFLLLSVGIKDDEGNRGVFSVIGAGLEAAETENKVYREFDVFLNEAGREAPTIIYQNTGIVYTGVFVVSDQIKARDADGVKLPVRLLAVSTPGTDGMFSPVPSETEEVEFINPGIYRLKVTAVDARRKRTTVIIPVPVNERRI